MNLKYFYEKKVLFKYYLLTYIIPLFLFFLSFLIVNIIREGFEFEIFINLLIRSILICIAIYIFSIIFSYINIVRDNNVKRKGIFKRCEITNFNTMFFKLSYQGNLTFKLEDKSFTVRGIYPDKNLKKLINSKEKFFVNIYQDMNSLFVDLSSISTVK